MFFSRNAPRRYRHLFPIAITALYRLMYWLVLSNHSKPQTEEQLAELQAQLQMATDRNLMANQLSRPTNRRVQILKGNPEVV
eukprot:CAMPEP_0118951200 /NCGR_PEP_ID=MMETSP1169-20130426/52714_1 /TAXON_ID=36882 /ORGANISM="Pyramimonas obovata, Strain CCMP722" /LENGTH=81 /DNA_ID=CAMNT_0006898213 /DNA_START=141 /DNA_END=383 /DNA_ORIENTATION=+